MMKYIYPMFVWFAALLVANEIGLERLNPASGMLVFLVLVWEMVRIIKRFERGCK